MTHSNSTPASSKAAGPAGPVVGEELVSSLYVKSKKIYPKAVAGLFANWRWALVWITQIVFYGLPWLAWNNRQAVLFDLETKRFYLFGLVLYPQDFIYLTALLLISAYALFLFTALAGRLWCGYACPQTVYTEIFLWFEHKFEGDRVKRMKLDEGPWTADKVRRKVGKHGAWVLFSLWTGFTFAGYFTPIHELGRELVAFNLGPWQTFWVLFYSFATYGMAGHMREQVCKYMCPYARFQSAMFDKDTLIISYDVARGDPRGSRSKKVDPRKAGLGDCVDCGLCVQVCPTGIDIRNGLQYECIGCAACVDVCDGVMDKMGYERGLVRYVTENGLANGWDRAAMFKRAMRPRVLIYSAILCLIVLAVGYSLMHRTPFKVDVVRDRASLGRLVDDGFVENVYRLQVMNATESAQRYTLAVEGLPGVVLTEPVQLNLGPAEAKWVTVGVKVPPDAAMNAGSGMHEIRFDIQRLAHDDVPAVQLIEKSTFMVPR